MKPEDIAAKACIESQAAHGMMGGSPYDCALRAARITLEVLGPDAENRLLEELKVNRGIFAMMSEQYTSRALDKIITEFEKSKLPEAKDI